MGPLTTKPTAVEKVDPESTIIIMGKGASQDFLAGLAKAKPRPVEVCLPERECFTRQHRWILTPDLLPATEGLRCISTHQRILLMTTQLSYFRGSRYVHSL